MQKLPKKRHTPVHRLIQLFLNNSYTGDYLHGGSGGIIIKGIITTGSASGNLTVKTQAFNDGSRSTTVYQNSFLKMLKIA